MLGARGEELEGFARIDGAEKDLSRILRCRRR
jgi:hypothetical protein